MRTLKRQNHWFCKRNHFCGAKTWMPRKFSNKKTPFLQFSIVPPKFFFGCLLDNIWCCIEIFGLFGGQKNVDKGIKACRHPDKGNVSSFFDVVMLVILLHSLCTCQEQSQNVGTFLSKKSWLRVKSQKMANLRSEPTPHFMLLWFNTGFGRPLTV